MKTCLITGGNAGIGKAAAIQIAAVGYRVFIGCRNESRGEKALEEIRKASGSEKVELVKIDMSLKASIEDSANLLTGKIDSLDVLIHNAADFDISRKSPVHTEEGIESVWATNHIGPVLLTSLLMEKLKTSDQGRIITVASQGLMMHPSLKVDMEDPEFRNRKFSVAKAYYQSKLAQVMYTYWLARELSDTPLTVNCIRVTNVKIDLERYPEISGFMKFLYSIKSRFSITPEDMARTYTYLATSADLSGISAGYFNEKNKQVKSSGYSYDREQIDAVMDLTCGFIDKEI